MRQQQVGSYTINGLARDKHQRSLNVQGETLEWIIHTPVVDTCSNIKTN